MILSVSLAAWLFHRSQEDAAAGQTIKATNLVAAPAVTAIEEVKIPVFITNRFHWRQIESTNYAEYLSNLRRIGCPERTAGDIVRSELRSVYVAREQALKNQYAGRDRRELRPGEPTFGELRFALRHEYWDHLKQLGIAADPAGDTAGGERLEMIAFLHFLIGPLSSEGKFNEVLKAFARADIEEDRRRERATDTNAPVAKPIGELFAAEMRGILSAAEFQEVAARLGTLRFFNGGPYSEVAGLTSRELRQIAVLQSKDDPRLLFLESMRDPEWVPEFAEQFTNDVKMLLGAERARLFWLANDGRFQSIHEFTKGENLPASAAVQLHDLRELVAAELKHTRQESDGGEVDQVLRMLEIEAKAQSAAKQILGKSSYEKFLGSGGYWLTNGSRL